VSSVWYVMPALACPAAAVLTWLVRRLRYSRQRAGTELGGSGILSHQRATWHRSSRDEMFGAACPDQAISCTAALGERGPCPTGASPRRHGARLPRVSAGASHRERRTSVHRRLAAVGLSTGAVLIMSACAAGRDSVETSSAGRFRFVNATARGTVIPLGSRKPAAVVTGTLIGGGTYNLVADRGKVVLINYWASWCAPCVTESPMLETVYGSLKALGVDFVGIDIKDEPQAAQSFITDNQMTYPMIYDEPAKTALQLGIPTGGLPVSVLVDRAGRIAAVYLGAVRRADIVPTLQHLASEAP
jgi:peroxiredoxin